MRISVCIPTHAMKDSIFFLERSFDALRQQTFDDFEVVITDNSDDSEIEDFCLNEKGFDLRYHRNPRKGMAQNTNEGIKRAKGELIKLLYLDDYLSHQNSLKDISTAFTGGWLVTACIHDDGIKTFNPHSPFYTDQIYLGANTIGSPSVLAMENNNPLLFDEKLTWLLDCDYYKLLYMRYGFPIILNTVNVAIGVGKHQTTHLLGDDRKKLELDYMRLKYECI